MSTEARRYEYKCPHCDGKDVSFSAAVYWIEDEQKFEIAGDVFDDYCQDCQTEISAEEIITTDQTKESKMLNKFLPVVYINWPIEKVHKCVEFKDLLAGELFKPSTSHEVYVKLVHPHNVYNCVRISGTGMQNSYCGPRADTHPVHATTLLTQTEDKQQKVSKCAEDFETSSLLYFGTTVFLRTRHGFYPIARTPNSNPEQEVKYPNARDEAFAIKFDYLKEHIPN